MSRRIQILMLLALAASFALPSGGLARAETRHAAVYSVTGPGGKKVQAFLESHIEEKHKLVVREALNDAARELGITRQLTSGPNLKKIARKARVDAVITGYIYRARRQWWLSLRVLDGGTGKAVKVGVVAYPYFALNKWNKAAITKLVDKGLENVEGVPHPPIPRIAEPEPEVKPTPKPPPPKAERPSWLTGVHVGAGVAILGRRLSFDNLELIPGSTVLYKTNSPIIPIAFYAEAYPGAFITQHRILANIGLGFLFQRAVGVVSYRESDNVEIATTVQRIGGYLSFRWNVSRSPTSPELKINLGVEAMEFSFAQDLGQVPGVLYLAFKPELKARFPLGTERVSLGLSFAGLALVSLGQITDAYHYGNGKGGGVEVGLEIDARIFWKVHLQAGFTTSWNFISFSQLGVQHLDYEYVADSARDGTYGGYVLMSLQY
ncbi:MAG: hypothetical protein RBU30_15655 [Polyangia bacterium]|jgi:hypothetical protein|nr:hypothetical protein [Polyangia bacterium]